MKNEKLKKFLEEERALAYKELCESNSNCGVDDYGVWIFNGDLLEKDLENLLKQRDTRLINTLLDIVGEEIGKQEKEKWVKVFDYHNDLSNERHTYMRNTARVEIEYWNNYDIKQILTNLKK